MSEDAVSRLFIQRFINNFGAPTAPDQEAFFAEYQRALGGTDDDILREASARVIDHHEFPQRWPTVAECKTAVDHVASERAEARNRRDWGKTSEQWKEPTPESKARVEVMMRQVIANLKAMGSKPNKRHEPLPDVSQPAWEARFGKPAKPQQPIMRDPSGNPDVSHDAWHARYGYKAGEIDRRFSGDPKDSE